MIRTFLKSLSWTVHELELDHIEHFQYDQEYCEDKNDGGGNVGNGKSPWKSLTVWRKSLCVGCNGFTVIDSIGNLVFRVDNYIGHPNQILLMDGLGNPILTISRRKQKLGLVDKWLVYEGEGGGGGDCPSSTTKTVSKPIYCARKHINILQHNHENTLARLYQGRYTTHAPRYVIEGSYGHRSCKVLDESRRVVAEIRKKEEVMEGISFGLDVFVLIVRPGFSPEFAMSIVLLLDQMFS